jgi:hypothetical protein
MQGEGKGWLLSGKLTAALGGQTNFKSDKGWSQMLDRWQII